MCFADTYCECTSGLIKEVSWSGKHPRSKVVRTPAVTMIEGAHRTPIGKKLSRGACGVLSNSTYIKLWLVSQLVCMEVLP